MESKQQCLEEQEFQIQDLQCLQDEVFALALQEELNKREQELISQLANIKKENKKQIQKPQESEQKIQAKREKAQNALGSLQGASSATVKALSNIEEHWELLRPPKGGDWLGRSMHAGQTYDQYSGKTVGQTRNKLYIQPIVYKQNSKITPKLLKNLQKWLEAFYQPCKIVICDKIYDDQLQGKGIGTQKNGYDKTQYNAIGILNKVVGPIQNSKNDAIGLISFTDVDLFTKDLSNFCFGYGIPSLGGVQSIHRFMPEWTDEQYENEEEFEDQLLLRVCKIATHEIGHMFNLKHCIYYQCLMMGTNHLEQTDRNPIQFCPVCYRKLQKSIGFDHVKRYKDLTNICNQFKGAFQKSQPYELNEQSYQEFFEKRYNSLKDTITQSDYKKIMGKTQLAYANNQSQSRSKSPIYEQKSPINTQKTQIIREKPINNTVQPNKKGGQNSARTIQVNKQTNSIKTINKGNTLNNLIVDYKQVENIEEYKK